MPIKAEKHCETCRCADSLPDGYGDLIAGVTLDLDPESTSILYEKPDVPPPDFTSITDPAEAREALDQYLARIHGGTRYVCINKDNGSGCGSGCLIGESVCEQHIIPRDEFRCIPGRYEHFLVCPACDARHSLESSPHLLDLLPYFKERSFVYK